MKLFQRLLVAPAALGLMAPVAVNADGAFSSTTVVSGGSTFTVGSISDGGTADNQEDLYMQYAYGLDLNSSFTGEDLFYVGVETGNATGPLANMDSATTGSSNRLRVHSVFYSFPVGNLAVTAGPLLDQDDVIAATLSAYSDAFRLGSMPWSTQGETGPGIAVEYANDNGVVASASFVSVDGSTSTMGIGGDNGDDVTTFTVGYNGDGFGGGLILTANDGENAASTGYDTFGGGVYWSPEAIDATISVVYDTQDPEGATEERSDLFVAIDYEVGDGTLSAAYNSTDIDGTTVNDTTGFEISYAYPINDSMTITPGFFTVEDTTGEDDAGFVVETSFSF